MSVKTRIRLVPTGWGSWCVRWMGEHDAIYKSVHNSRVCVEHIARDGNDEISVRVVDATSAESWSEVCS